MSATSGKGPIFDPGLCRCCGSMKKCRLLNTEYISLGQKEVYCDMIMDCFGLLLSHLDGVTSERLICATCVTRVREALSFKRQVLKCEEAFLHMKIYDGPFNEPDTTMVDTLGEHPKIKVEIVKCEPLDVPETEPDDTSHCGDTASVDMDTLKPEMEEKSIEDDSNDDLPLKHHIVRHTQEMQQKIVTKTIKNTIMRPIKRLVPPIKLKPKLPMSKVQQQIRERDPTYMTETNILTIVEFSYVCPFKCRHNHLLCYYCGELFSDPALLREHSTNHSPKKFKINEHRSMVKIDLFRIDCRLCSTKIDNLEDFKTHVTSVHKKMYYFNCKDSVLPFVLSKNESKCAVCGLVFSYFHALNKHMNVHYSNYVCETCGLGFVDRNRFVMHQMRHEQGDFPCKTCGKVFKAQYNMELHVDRVHKKKGRVYCPKCDVRLMSYPQKLKHLIEVHGEEPLSFPCGSCDRIFDARRALTLHKRKEHLKDYRYECQCCGQRFFTQFALNNHMPKHTGERNFKCKVCEKSYPRLKTLKDHMRIHTNDRRYRCHVCGQAFIQNCSLKGHMKSQHPEYVFNSG